MSNIGNKIKTEQGLKKDSGLITIDLGVVYVVKLVIYQLKNFMNST